MLQAAGLQLELRRTGERQVEGHAYDPALPERRLVVELLLDGEPARLERAEGFDAALLAAGIGDGCYGFRFSVEPEVLANLRRIGVRIANLDPAPLREIETADELHPASPGRGTAGAVEWPGGLRLSGWVRRSSDGATPLVEAFLDGERIAFARADLWREVTRGGDSSVEHAFTLFLPRFLADGAARRIEIRQAERALEGSPVAVLAFADGLEADLAARSALRGEAARGRLFDLACPDAVPFAMFEAWDARFFPAPAVPRLGRPFALAAVGETEAGRRTPAGPAGNSIGTVLAADGGPTRFDAGDLVRFLDGPAAACPVVFLVTAGTILRPGAAARLTAALEADPAAEIAYGDILLEGPDGAASPLFLPAFDEERFREQGIAGLGFAMKRGAAIKAARRGIAELFRLFLSPLETGAGASAHLHVPGAAFEVPPLDGPALQDALAEATAAHLTARGVEADIHRRPEASLPSIRVRRKTARASLTIVLDAAADEGSGIEAALDALEDTRRRTGAEVLVVAQAMPDPLRQRLSIDGVPILAALPQDGFAARLGAGAERAETDLLCFLDTRLRPAGTDWLDEMTSRLADPRTGAVAPLVVSPLGMIVDAGWVLRPAGRAVPAFRDRSLGDPGTGDALLVARQVSVLGRRCLLTRRTDFLAVGGFDPQLFPHHGGDIDFSLKLHALGRRLVVTPDAELVLAGDVREAESPAATRRRERAERLLFARWPDAFAGDAFYSPLLDRGEVPYSGLAWPPGASKPRRPMLAPARHVPPGW